MAANLRCCDAICSDGVPGVKQVGDQVGNLLVYLFRFDGALPQKFVLRGNGPNRFLHVYAPIKILSIKGYSVILRYEPHPAKSLGQILYWRMLNAIVAPFGIDVDGIGKNFPQQTTDPLTRGILVG